LYDLLQSNLVTFAAAVVAALLVLALVAVIAIWRTCRLEQRLDALTRGADGRTLEGVFDAHLQSVFRVSHELNELTARTSRLESLARRHFGRVGVVRFNAFEDTGGNQSFALVMLDEAENGLIMSSLHSRNATRLYAKVMTAGRCDVALSTEEAQALQLARAQPVSDEPRPSSRRRQARPAGAETEAKGH
jgi:hypothetical protein